MTAAAAHCDVTSKSEVDALVNWAVKQYGGLDLLVSNAGIVKAADFVDMTEEDFDAVINVNLKGTFLCVADARYHLMHESTTFHAGSKHALQPNL